MPLLELQNFLNDLVTDSPRQDRAMSAPTPSDNLGGNRTTKKRPFEDLEVKGSMRRFQRGEGFVRGRGRGNLGG
jgi:hypothetical protein